GILTLVIAATVIVCVGNNYSSPPSQSPILLWQKQWQFEDTRHYTGDTEDIFIVP
ncbi:unnamed protein product, partial [marine sediment metagenome]